MRAQVIHNQVNRPLVPAGHHHFFPESLARFRILVRGPSPYRCSCGGAESSKPLQRSAATIAVRSPGRTLTPLLAASGNGLKRSRFIKTDDNPSFRRMTIEIYDGVFFTSNSGSSLWHHVCPVKNRRPWCIRMRRMVSRLSDFRPAWCLRCSSSLAKDHVVKPNPRSGGREVAV